MMAALLAMGEWWKEPFFQVALPILVGLSLAHWGQNKRNDDLRGDMNRQFGEVTKRLDTVDGRLQTIEGKLTKHGEEIAILKDRETRSGVIVK